MASYRFAELQVSATARDVRRWLGWWWGAVTWSPPSSARDPGIVAHRFGVRSGDFIDRWGIAIADRDGWLPRREYLRVDLLEQAGRQLNVRVSLTDPDAEDLYAALLADLQAIGPKASARTADVPLATIPGGRPTRAQRRATARAAEARNLRTAGLTRKEIALRLGCSVRTVDNYLK